MSTAVLSGNLRYLPQVPDDETLVARCVRDALTVLKSQGAEQPTWDQFMEALREKVRQENAKPSTKRLVLFFLHLRGPWLEHKRLLRVLDMRFRRRTWAQVRRLQGWGRFLERARAGGHMGGGLQTDFMNRFVPLIVEVCSRTCDEAIGLSERRFEVLRASINYVRGYGIRTLQGGRPRPLGVCLPPPAYGVFEGDGTYETLYLSDTLYEYGTPANYEPDRGQAVERLIRQINDLADQKVRDLLVDLLLKYGQAMDTTDWRSAFLALWQILEVASLRGKRSDLKTEEIGKRVLSLVRYKPVVQDLLDLLMEDRHALVHEGRFSEEGLERVNHLKLIAEPAIAGLLDRLRKFPDARSLEEFYRQARQPEEALRLRRKVIGRILGG